VLQSITAPIRPWHRDHAALTQHDLFDVGTGGDNGENHVGTGAHFLRRCTQLRPLAGQRAARPPRGAPTRKVMAALGRFPAIGTPIDPKPMNPTFI